MSRPGPSKQPWQTKFCHLELFLVEHPQENGCVVRKPTVELGLQCVVLKETTLARRTKRRRISKPYPAPLLHPRQPRTELYTCYEKHLVMHRADPTSCCRDRARSLKCSRHRGKGHATGTGRRPASSVDHSGPLIRRDAPTSEIYDELMDEGICR